MPDASALPLRGAAVIGCLLAPVAIHLAIATGHDLPTGLGGYSAIMMVLTQVGVIAWIALGLTPARRFRWGGCIAAVGLAAWLCASKSDGLVVSAAIPHALAYLCVLGIFADSLCPGRRPIITIFAEKSRGALPASVVRYTRRVTVAWCLFCLGQLAASLFLLVFAPRWVWSLFVNVLNIPLLAMMFCAEFTWRKWRHGSRAQERLTDGFRLAEQLANPGLHTTIGGRAGQVAGGASPAGGIGAADAMGLAGGMGPAGGMRARRRHGE